MKILPPPGPARTRQLTLLAVLLVGAVYVISQVAGGPPTSPAVLTSNSQPPSVPVAGGTSAMPEPLSLQKLEPAAEPPATTRNPFRFGTRSAPPVGPPAYVPSAGPALPAAPPRSSVAPIALKFIGRVVLPDGSVIAVLSDDKGNVFEGTEGQVVDGRYRITRIGQESLVIEHTDGTGRTTLQLRGS